MTLPPPPRVYSDAAAEYRAVTEAAALHDNSRTGRLQARGEDALDLLNRLSTNGVVNLPPGRGAPTILTTDRGRILDLLGVVNTGACTLLLTSPGTQQRVMEWLDKYTIMEDLTVTDGTTATALLTVCGPRSEAALASILDTGRDTDLDTGFDPGRDTGLDTGLTSGRAPERDGKRLETLEPYSAFSTIIAGQEALVIRRPLGELPAFDLLTGKEAAPAIWQTLTAAGLTPAGLESYEAALVQYAVPRYGRELGDAYNPLEAGLIGSIDFAKGCYIGQEVIARLDTYKKVQKYLVRLRFSAGGSVSEGANLEQEGRNVGQVTSLAVIPTTGELLGLGYVRTARATAGAQLALAAPAQGSAEIIALSQLFGPGEG